MQEVKSTKELMELPNQPGLDDVIHEMINLGIPVTLKNYLEFEGLNPDEIGPELQASLPRVLFDPKLKDLKASGINSDIILRVMADNPEATEEGIQEHLDML